MIFNETHLLGAFLIDLEKKEDERGFFARYYCKDEFLNYNLEVNWTQINNSLSLRKGTLRGLHFQQEPHSEVKLVRCIRGAVWDVIVDIRLNSLSYGKWFAAELNADNRKMMYVPKGFAHGFISLLDNSEVLYMVSEFYSPKFERTLRWDDKFHGINWPITPKLISEKDRNAGIWDGTEAVKI